MAIPKASPGYKRQWYRCKQRGCGRAFFKDYIPYSLSNPVMWTPCGHSIGHGDYNMVAVTAKEGISLLAKWKKKQKAKAA